MKADIKEVPNKEGKCIIEVKPYIEHIEAGTRIQNNNKNMTL